MTLPNGSSRLRIRKNLQDHPKKKVSETGSGSYRHRADRNASHERSPKTETDSFNIESNTAGQYPCLAGLHTF